VQGWAEWRGERVYALWAERDAPRRKMIGPSRSSRAELLSPGSSPGATQSSHTHTHRMSLYWPQQPSRKAPGRKWPDKDVLWIKMLWLNWMEVDQITSRTGIDKR
jgi:hypothetical protein